jgi:hypothetical protein
MRVLLGIKNHLDDTDDQIAKFAAGLYRCSNANRDTEIING